MSDWLNFVTINVARNGTTSHTVNPASTGAVVAGTAFTPTAGRLLVAVIEGAVTSSTPTGWTLPTSGSAVNNTGLYVWYRTAAGSDSLTTTHNGSNYPVAVSFFEFAAGSTFVKSASSTAVAVNGASASLTGLTGTNWLASVKVTAQSSGWTYTGATWAGTPTPTELVDTSVTFATTDGYGFTLAEANASTATTWAPTASIGGTGLTNCETLTFAVNVAAGGSTTTGAVSSSVPRTTASVTGTQTDPGTVAAAVPVAAATMTATQTNQAVLNASLPVSRAALTGAAVNTAVLAGTVPTITATGTGTATNPGSMSASVPVVAGAVAGQATNAGSVASAPPIVTASVTGAAVNPGQLTSSTPRVVTSLAEAGSSNTGTLNATLPVPAAVVAGAAVNSGTLSGKVPSVTATVTGSMVNAAVLNTILPGLAVVLAATQSNPGTSGGVVPLPQFHMDSGIRRNITVTVTGPTRAALTVTLTRDPLTVTTPTRNPFRTSGATR